MKFFHFTIFSIFIISNSLAQKTEVWMDSLDFVYLDEILVHAIYDVRYASEHNFVGTRVKGYKSQRLVLTRTSAQALRKIEILLYNKGYGLKIYDTYRPQTAVNHFIDWAKDPSDTLTKHEFYPRQNKKHLFKLGYISSRSGHSRGSTIDLTIYNLSDGSDVDMGSPYDFFGEISHHSYQDISMSQMKNRLYLKTAMSKGGFRSYAKEWWHYTLRKEPYPKTFFDCIVEP